MVIQQGDIYWLQPEPGDIPHPHVVIQVNDGTLMLCALTSNIQRIHWPGNVLLKADEANLSKPSVVEVSKVATVDAAQIGEYIGTLGPERVQQIQAGIRFVGTFRAAD